MPMIRRQVSIEASPRAAWNAFTRPEGLQAWIASSARVDGRQGGRVQLGMADGTEHGGYFHGFRPTSRLEVRWDRGPWKGAFTSVAIARDGAETVVNLQHDGPGMDDEATRAPLDEFWRKVLLGLRDKLEAE